MQHKRLPYSRQNKSRACKKRQFNYKTAVFILFCVLYKLCKYYQRYCQYTNYPKHKYQSHDAILFKENHSERSRNKQYKPYESLQTQLFFENYICKCNRYNNAELIDRHYNAHCSVLKRTVISQPRKPRCKSR